MKSCCKIEAIFDVNSRFRWILHIFLVSCIRSTQPTFCSCPIVDNLNYNNGKSSKYKTKWKYFVLPLWKHWMQNVWRQVSTIICWFRENWTVQRKHRTQPNFSTNPSFCLRSIFNLSCRLFSIESNDFKMSKKIEQTVRMQIAKNEINHVLSHCWIVCQKWNLIRHKLTK